MKKVLSLWKVIVLIISAFVGVGGATALTLYLTGGLKEEVVEPQDIYFETTISEGEGYYNAALSQFEVASDTFKMKISSSTEDVTETRVTLSLLGQSAPVDGYITDGVIKVPEQVEINKAFTVTLEQSFDNNLDKYLVMGGNSILTAKSSNVLIDPQTVKVAVDCPVDSIRLNVDSSNDELNAETQTVIVGETFDLDVDFLPENSHNLFSDSSRKKEVFYNFTKSYISYNWETGKFVANEKSGNAYDTISVYTFKNAFYQKQVLENYSYITNREELTSAVLGYFKNHPEACVTKSINIKVDSVDVAKFEMKGGNKSFAMPFDKQFVITAGSNTANATLDLVIEDDNGNSLKSLYSNVGLRIPADNENFTALSFEGGNVLKVEFLAGGETAISKVQNVASIDWDAENVEYYLLPNTAPKYYEDYFWSFAVESDKTEDMQFEFKINFFYENIENKLVAFCDFNEGLENSEQTLVLTASVGQGIEESIGWSSKEQSAISLTISYDEKGVSKSDDVDLQNYIGEVSTTNTYQTLKYFLVVPSTAEDGFDIHDYFVCEEGKDYAKDYLGNDLKLSNVNKKNEVYTLYELSDSILTAKKSFGGNIYVVAATIKTKADGKAYLDDQGRYLFVRFTNSAKEVSVDSTLSIANMNPTFEFLDEDNRIYVDDSGRSFVPLIAKNESNDDLDLIRFNLTLSNCETFDVDYNSNSDVSKVLKAERAGDLKLECVSNSVVTDYVELDGLQYIAEKSDEAAGIAVFQGVIKINRAAVGESAEGVLVSLRFVYDDGIEIYTKEISNDEGKTGFYIYSQQATTLVGAFEEDDSKKDGDEYLPVTVDVSAEGGTVINWGGDLELEDLNTSLAFEIYDQFGQLIRPKDGVYRVRLKENTGKGILSFNSDGTQIQYFNTTDGVATETQMIAQVVLVGSDDKEKVVEGLESPVIKFNVTSESIEEVWYDSQTAGVGFENNNQGNTAKWKKADSTSTVEIERFIAAGDEFVLDNVVRMYADKVEGATAEEKAENVKNDTTEFYQRTEFYFDPTYLAGLNQDKAKQIIEMFSKNDGKEVVGTGIVLADGETAPEDSSDLRNFAGKKIKSLAFAYPFKDDDIEIVFKATGENATLFNVTIKLVCLADLTINTSKFSEYESKYEDYLVSEEESEGKIRVFGAQTFDLDEYADLQSSTQRHVGEYTWSSLYTNMGNTAANFSTINPTSGVASIVFREGKLVLDIAEVYDYTTLVVALYYGRKSDYSTSITLRFYIHPNIVVQQVAGDNVIEDKSTILGVDQISADTKVENYYKFYRLVSNAGGAGYLDESGVVKGFADATALTIANISFTNESSAIGNYIKIDSGVIGFDGQKAIDFALESDYTQTFAVKVNSTTALKAARVVDGDNGQIIVDKTGVKLDFKLALSYEISGLLSKSGVPVETVTYGEKEYLLLAPGQTYDLADGYSVSAVSGLINTSGAQAVRTSGLNSGYVNLNNNRLGLVRTFGSGENTLEVTINLDAFISSIGDKFVYYNNNDFDSTNMEYNKFGSVDLKDILELNDASVYQNVNAGQTYTVVHNIDEALTNASINDVIGFYFSAAGVKAYTAFGDTRVSVSIEKDDLGLATLSKLQDNDNYETQLKIKHLDSLYAQNYGDIFIVLKFEIYKIKNTSDNFVWKYRIKVNPSFTLEEVVYPYADEAEYLTEIHSGYDGEKYVVDLEENLDFTNSRFASGMRFAKPVDDFAVLIDGVDAKYVISEIKVDGTSCREETDILKAISDNFETLNVSAVGVLTAQIKSTKKIDVTITKTYYTSGEEMYGSNRDYVVKFNQGGAYTHKLIANIKGADKDLSGGFSTELIHSQELTAGSGEVVYTATIQADAGNGSFTNITDFGAYVKALNGASLYDALVPYGEQRVLGKYKYSVEAGTPGIVNVDGFDIPYTAQEKLTIERVEKLDLSQDYAEVVVTYNEAEVVAKVESKYVLDESIYYYIDEDYYYLDDDNKLHITPLDSIKKDVDLEIGYYVLQKQTGLVQRMVFKVEAGLTSSYKHVLKDDLSLVGGKKYSMSDIFSDLTTEEVTFAIEEIDDAKYSDDVTMKEVVIVSKDENGLPIIEFANLAKDVSIKFKGVFNKDLAMEYSFEFVLNVKASVDLSEPVLATLDATSGASRYTNKEFIVNSDDFKAVLPFSLTDRTGDDFNRFVCETTNADGEVEIVHSATKKICYSTYVSKTTYVSQDLDMVYRFEGKIIFDFVVRYRYKVEPSVSVDSNHPKPNGTTELEAEYVSTQDDDKDTKFSATIQDFFNTTADFAAGTRINIEKKVESAKFIEEYGENWTIGISNISNAVISVNGSYYDANIEGDENQNVKNTFKENGIIIENALLQGSELSEDNRPNLDITFEIENTDADGIVEFSVVVNGVSTTYKVVLKQGSVYDVSLNSPNYVSTQETIYAEDISGQELSIFAPNRIVKFKTKSTAATGKYYLRFVKNQTNDVESLDITITNDMLSEDVTNIDLGMSLVGYAYAGTYADMAKAAQGLAADRLDNDLYEVVPVLTSRIVATYAGHEIDVAAEANKNFSIQLKERKTRFNENGELVDIQNADGTFEYKIDTSANEYLLDAGSYAKTTTVDIYLYLNSELFKDLNKMYRYYLDVEMHVENAINSREEISRAHTFNLNANNGKTPYILTDIVQIKNKRTNKDYDQYAIEESAGKINLEIYGFSSGTNPLPVDVSNNLALNEEGLKYITDPTVSEAERLKRVAGYFHKKLYSTENEDGTIFYTGLIPNYKMSEINDTSVTSNSYENFVSVEGIEGVGKTLDYKILAYASNNDGNHVMMRLSYSVDINGSEEGGVVTKYFNLLFKVSPNSTVKFETGYGDQGEGTNNFIQSANEVIDGQSVATNYQQIYEINNQDESANITLWTTESNGHSSIDMRMYGSSVNQAKNFDYTIKLNQQIGAVSYNDLDAFKEWLEQSSGAWARVDDDIYKHTSDEGATGGLTVEVPLISLGKRDYMIEIENAYGFKARFYYRFTAPTAPKIESMTNTLLEEDSVLAFTSNYYKVSPTYNEEKTMIQFQPFTYRSYEYGDKYYADTLMIRTIGFGDNAYGTMNSITSKLDDRYSGVGSITASYQKDDGTWSDSWDLEVISDKAYGSSSNGDRKIFYKILGSKDEDEPTAEELVGKEIVLSLNTDDAKIVYEISYFESCLTKDSKFYYAAMENGIYSGEPKEAKAGEETGPIAIFKNGDCTPVLTAISSSHTISSNPSAVQDLKLPVGETEMTRIALGGFDAYALKQVDYNLATDFISDVNNVFVKEVDFYYNDTWIGGSHVVRELEGETYKSNFKEFENSIDLYRAPILTSEDFWFVNKASEDGSVEVQKGSNGENPWVFKVPHINGRYFGTGNVLENVTMKVTLISDGLETSITNVVSIKKQANTEGLFKTDLRDGETPQLVDGNNDILNDTLEVNLEAGATVSFMLHDEQIAYTNWDSETKTATYAIDINGKEFAPKVLTLSNPNSFAITKYVGISANISNLESNFVSGSKFYIYDFGTKEDNVTFEYNGSSVESATKTSDLDWLKCAKLEYVEGFDKLSFNVAEGKTAKIAILKELPKLEEFKYLRFESLSDGENVVNLSEFLGDVDAEDGFYVLEDTRENYRSVLTGATYKDNNDALPTHSEVSYSLGTSISTGFKYIKFEYENDIKELTLKVKAGKTARIAILNGVPVWEDEIGKIEFKSYTAGENETEFKEILTGFYRGNSICIIEDLGEQKESALSEVVYNGISSGMTDTLMVGQVKEVQENFSWVQISNPIGYDAVDDKLTLVIEDGMTAKIALTTERPRNNMLHKLVWTECDGSVTIDINELLAKNGYEITDGQKFYVIENLQGHYASALSNVTYNEVVSFDYMENTSSDQFVGEIGYYHTSSQYTPNALQLSINHIDEIPSGSKNETLYFLKVENGQSYQFVETFTIHSLYTKAQECLVGGSGGSVSAGDNKMTIDDYMIVENETDNSKYYVVRLDQWASNIALTNEACGLNLSKLIKIGTESGNEAIGTESDNEAPYKFDFAISGAAYIDENGTITTSKNYDLTYHQMTVTIYMKMSGVDGNFEKTSSAIAIGTFVLNLNPEKEAAVKTGVGKVSATSLDDEVLSVEFVKKEGATSSNPNATVYLSKQAIDSEEILNNSISFEFDAEQNSIYLNNALKNSLGQLQSSEQLYIAAEWNYSTHDMILNYKGKELSWSAGDSIVNDEGAVLASRYSSFVIEDFLDVTLKSGEPAKIWLSTSQMSTQGLESLEKKFEFPARDDELTQTIVVNNTSVNVAAGETVSGKTIYMYVDGEVESIKFNGVPVSVQDNQVLLNNVYVLNDNIIVIEPGSILYSSKVIEGKIISDLTDQTIYSGQVGNSLNFEDWFGENNAIKDLSNRNYHIVRDGEEYISYGNVNSWTFTQKGLRKIDVVVTGRVNGSDTLSYYLLKNVNVLVYDDILNEQKSIGVADGSKESLAEGNWYEKKSGGTLEKKTSYEPTSQGVFEVDYVVVKDGLVRNVKHTYYVYGASDEKSIALQKSETYMLEDNLKSDDAEYKFYDDSFKKISSLSFAFGEHSMLDRVVYMFKQTENDTTLTPIQFTVKIVGASVTEKAIVYVKDTDTDTLIEQIKETIASSIKDLPSEYKSKYDFELKDADGNYINNCCMIEALDGHSLVEAGDGFKQMAGADTVDESDDVFEPYTRYLVTYRDADGNIKLYRFKFDIYACENAVELIVDVEPNNAFELSNLNEGVKEKVFGSLELTEQQQAAGVRYFELEGTSLKEVTSVNAENGHEGDYIVLILDKYYKANVTLELRSGEIEG